MTSNREGVQAPAAKSHRLQSPHLPHRLRWLAVWGPGLLTMLADADAGNVVTAAQAGALWGYRLLPLTLLLIPVLFSVQELTVRLGLHARAGYGELIRERFSPAWRWIAGAALVVATVGSLVTEFTAVAGVGELFGVPRAVALALAAAALLLAAENGSYRRIERLALLVGLFELAFFAVAAMAHPHFATLAAQALDFRLGDRTFLFLAAATVGASFNPWLIFYQQSAIADKGLQPRDFGAARWETLFGATLAQCLTGAVLVAAAATLGGAHEGAELSSIGDISKALSPLLGAGASRIVFGVAVLGASLVAAIVCSLAFAWGIGELAGRRRSLERTTSETRWFFLLYGVAVLGSAAGVATSSDLVRLNIAAQALNAFLLPPVIGCLIVMAITVLPANQRPRNWSLRLTIIGAVVVCALGLVSAVWAMI